MLLIFSFGNFSLIFDSGDFVWTWDDSRIPGFSDADDFPG